MEVHASFRVELLGGLLFERQTFAKYPFLSLRQHSVSRAICLFNCFYFLDAFFLICFLLPLKKHVNTKTAAPNFSVMLSLTSLAGIAATDEGVDRAMSTLYCSAFSSAIFNDRA